MIIGRNIWKYWSALFAIAWSAVAVQILSKYSFRRVCDSLMLSLRSQTYNSLINQSISYFNKVENSTGIIISTLSSDIRNLNGASIALYILRFHGLTSLWCGEVLMFIYSWKMGVIIGGVLPLGMIAFIIQFQIQFIPPSKSSQYAQRQARMISDSIMNHETLASLSYEDEYLAKYELSTNCESYLFNNENNHITKFDAFLLALIFGASQAVTGVITACTYLISAHEVEKGKDIEHLHIASAASTMGAILLSIALMNAPNFNKGKEVATKLLNIIWSPREGLPESQIINGTEILTKEKANKDICFNNVWFSYPNCKNKWVLRGINMKIKGGEWVGFSGDSGWGKSTILQLLLRFYDPNKGSITIDGISIKEFTLKSLRSWFGLVQQEPLLFNWSILENIIYSKPHATSSEVRISSQIANASEFIDNLNVEIDKQKSLNESEDKDQLEKLFSELNDGYRVKWGSRGEKLSGGQKQRIAIARAICRNPSILLLDQATSALDEASQKEVQVALDSVAKKSTWIIVAHRLSTLANWKRILQFENGILVSEKYQHL